MSIGEIAVFAEIVGATATVVTLAYLAIQVRENTRVTRAQSAQNTQSRNDLYSTSIAENPQLADVFHRGLINVGSLTDGERIQLTFLFSMIVGVVEGEFDEVRRGIGDSAHLKRSIGGIVGLMKTPAGRHYWDTFGETGGYDVEFRAFMDEHLSK